MFKLFIVILLILGSCNPTSPLPPVATASPLPIFTGAPTAAATPFDVRTTTFNNSTPNPIGLGLPFGPTVHGVNPPSKGIVPTQDSGGQAGFNIVNNGYLGIYANNTVYTDLELPYNNVNGNFEVLYAPTTKGGSNSCLESSMDYWQSSPKLPTSRFLRLYDFCNDVHWNTGINIPVDAIFKDNYVRDLGNGLPEYTIEIFGSVNQSWRFFLYNYKTNQWELKFTSQPGSNNYNGGESWSIFETHYTSGPCPVIPLIESNNILMFDSTNGWVGAVDYLNSTSKPFGFCFDNNGYLFTQLPESSGWLVSN